MNNKTIREMIPALGRAAYLNTGTFGPSPSVVMDEIRNALDLIEAHGAYSPVVRQSIEQEAYEQTRTEAAGLLEATPDEIILTRSTSDGINVIAHGLDWRRDDNVVISDEEHASGIVPWQMLAKRAGIKIRVAKLSNDPDQILQSFDEQITNRTRLVFVSHVSCLSGIRLPVGKICRLAHDRGALAAIDGAHAVGQFPVDVREIGCDAYVACGHKWLLGPQGTSMAYIASEHLESFQPSWIGWGAHEEFKFDPASTHIPLHDSARRFEFGTKQWPLFSGLGRAIRFINEISTSAIEKHVQPLATILKQAIDEQQHLRRITPMSSECSSGIVSMALGKGTDNRIKEMLWERYNLIVAYNVPYRCLRLSVAFFTTQSEIELALNGISDLTSHSTAG